MKTAGVILAGGLARRMNHQDKGLILYQHRPLVSYAIHAIMPVVDELLINANRNLEQYQALGFPVISDLTTSFDGPLAGILAAMSETTADIFLIMPCDAPYMTSLSLKKLLHALLESDADIAVACVGEQWHSVFLAMRSNLKCSLAQYLASEQRKIQTWLTQQHTLTVDFSECPEQFANFNSFAELNA